jgi:cobalt-zinc-cadmium efflux system outer membrane protein
MKITYSVSLAVAGLLSGNARAQEPPPPLILNLRGALAAATNNNPILASAEGLKLQAGLKPNPRIVFQTENGRFWESPGINVWRDTDTYLYGAQVIERGQKRERRLEYATAGVARAESERDAVRVQLQGRVAAAYWNAAAASRIVDFYHQDLQTFEQIVEFNRSRVREGATAGVDLLRIEIEHDQLSATARRAEQDADLARVALLREMGSPEFPAVVFSDSVEQLPNPVLDPIDEVLSHRKDVLAAEAGVRHLEQNVALQKANAKTDPEFQIGYKRTAGFDTIYGAVSIPLAVRNRNQGNISAAEAEQRSAQHLADALRNHVRAEYEAARRDYAAKRAAFEANVTPLRAKTREVARIANAAYREGGVELLRFLDAERIRIQTEVLYFRSLAELQQSIVSLKIAEGEEL